MIARLSIVLRLTDQVAWSGAFFLVNIVAVSQLTVGEYASLAIATSIGFIAVAVVRSGAITASIVAAASVRIPPHQAVGRYAPYVVSGGAALLAALICGLMLKSQGSGNAVEFAVASGLMVLADVPRQILVSAVRYGRALVVSLVYSAGAVALFLAFFVGQRGYAFSISWIAVLVAVFVAGSILQLRRDSAALPRSLLLAYGWRNGAESLYAGIASQIAILIAFWLNDPDSTSGLRLSYALVFAPAFTLVQGLMPVLINRVANASIGTDTGVVRGPIRRIAALWVSASAGVFALCGVGALALVATGWGNATLSTVIPFLLPTGLNIIGAQTLEIAILVNRFSWTARGLHRLRLWLVGVEIGITLTAVWMGGLDGLVVALVVLGLAKAIVGLSMIRALRR